MIFRARLYCAGVRVAISPNLQRMMTDFLGRRWSQTTAAPSLIVLDSVFCGCASPLEADVDAVCDMYFGLLEEHPEWKFEEWWVDAFRRKTTNNKKILYYTDTVLYKQKLLSALGVQPPAEVSATLTARQFAVSDALCEGPAPPWFSPALGAY